MNLVYACRMGVGVVFATFVAIYFMGVVVEALNIQSVDFESSSMQYLSIADSEQVQLDGSLNMTVETWVKFESLPGFDQNAGFVTKSISVGDNRSYTFYYSGTDGKLRWVNQSDGFNGTDVGVNWVPSLGVWYHIAASKAGSNITFFVNGSQLGLVQVGTAEINDSTAPLRIGAHGNGEAYFDGLIDDVRVWNVARTQGEIVADMNRELKGNESGLVGYWKLNNSLEDATANNNDLTNVNAAQFSLDVPFSDDTNPEVTIQSMLGDLTFAHEQSWISKGVYTSISAKLVAASNMKSSVSRTAILRNVKKEIEHRHGNGINDAAYELLIEDIDALLR